MASVAAPWRRTHLLRARLVWPVLLVLVGIGTAVSVIRIVGVLTGWSAFTTLADLFPPALVSEGQLAEQWYARHGTLTVLHVAPGALFLLAIPFQLLDRVRERHPAIHRWLGRSLVAVGIPVAISGVVLGALSPLSTTAADSAIFLFGVLFLVAILRGFVAARGQRFTEHRRWMLRAAAVAVGVATVRIVALPLYAVVGGSALALTGPAFWLGLGLSAAVAEWWLWQTRRSGYERRVLPNWR